MTIDELHDYCRFLLEHHYTHDRPGAWSRGYTFALGHIMHKCHAGLSDEDRQRIADWREKHWKDTEMSAAETDERTLPMADTHYAVSIRSIYDAHTDMLKGYKLILWMRDVDDWVAMVARDYPTGMLDPIPQQTLDDADALARIFRCRNYRNDETEMWNEQG